MDTEHGFLGNLKARWARIQRVFPAEITAGKCRPGMESQDPTGQNGGYLGETLVRRQRRRIIRGPLASGKGLG